MDDSITPVKEAEEDMDLPDAPPLGEDNTDNRLPPSDSAQKQDVKLEDLFHDEDSDDEEFPTSGTSNGKMQSSPPAVPM